MRSAVRWGVVVVIASLSFGCPSKNNGADGGQGGGSAGGSGGGTAGGGSGGGGTGGGGGSGGGTGGGSLSKAQFCPAFAAAYCARETNCHFLDTAQAQACLTGFQAQCDKQFAKDTAGAARYDPVAGKACVDSITAWRCIEGPAGSANSLPSACSFHTVFTPNAQLGGKCDSDRDCVSGFCSDFCGTCKAFATLGADCTPADVRCDPKTSFCGTPDGGSDGGQSCIALYADSTDCNASSQCQSDYCNFQDLIDGGQDHCGHIIPNGQPCFFGEDCQSSYCPVDTCAPRIALGGACTYDSLDDGCVAGTKCFGGTCKSIPVYSLGQGAECHDNGQCSETLFCNGFMDTNPDGGPAGVCAPRLAAGATCDLVTYNGADCSAGNLCNASSQCQPLHPVGGACSVWYECTELLTCLTGDGGSQCATLTPIGGACDVQAGSICAANDFSGWCSNGTCVNDLAAGAPCDPNDDHCSGFTCTDPGDGGQPKCAAACF